METESSHDDEKGKNDHFNGIERLIIADMVQDVLCRTC